MRIKNILLAIVALLIFSAVGDARPDTADFAEGTKFVSWSFMDQKTGVPRISEHWTFRAADNGNPDNWCRNGLFPSGGEDFRIATVTGRRNEKVFFYKDDKGDCPEGAGCKSRSYVIPGDELLISNSYGNYACSWYQPKKGSETVGWIPLDRLSIAPPKETVSESDWIGDWSFYDNAVEISKGAEPGSLKIGGTAFWKGLGDNIHIGELDNSAVPDGDKLSFGGADKYDCRVKMQRAGRFLIVSDNLNCGGMNVTFNGVYRKR